MENKSSDEGEAPEKMLIRPNSEWKEGRQKKTPKTGNS